MVNITNLTKSFGSELLFDKVSFRLNRKEKVGVVGRNGHGKTTLFRIIMGKEDFDSGEFVVPRDYTIGWMEQEINFSEGKVLTEGSLALSPEERDNHWQVEKILMGLGFTESDLNKNPNDLSGGFQIRLNLAKVLLQEPDLLLLDEPNNFLDIMSIRWLIRFLSSWPKELLLITHDRSFMDSVVTHTLGVYRKKFRKIRGHTTKLYTQIAQEEEVYEKTRINDEKKQKDTELFISRFRAKARLAGLVQSRIKSLSKAQKNEKLERIRTLDFSFQSKPFNGKYLLNVENLSFGYGPDSPLFSDLNFSVKSKDRIFVIGKNGKGKTTFLKILSDYLKPSAGNISFHQAAKVGYYEQDNRRTLVDTRTVVEEIMAAGQGIEMPGARNIAGLMMFEGDNALKKIKVLSGGEKSRVMLGKLLAAPVNLLLLDEPTNHLDMESCDSLLTAMLNFDGAVIMVTHNELLLHSMAQRLIIFQDNKAALFEGTYQDFLEKRGWDDETMGDRISKKITNNKSNEIQNKKELRKNRSQIISNRSKTLNPLEKKISAIEKEIGEKELLEKNLNSEIIHASGLPGGKKINELSQKVHACKNEIESLYVSLEQLLGEFEKQSAYFERELEGPVQNT